MNYSKKDALNLIHSNTNLIGKNIFKTNIDVKITDIIVAPTNDELFSKFIKEYTSSINYLKSLDSINNDENYRVLVVSFNQFDNMLYYQDLDKYQELVLEN
jgi:hypothetical protein